MVKNNDFKLEIIDHCLKVKINLNKVRGNKKEINPITYDFFKLNHLFLVKFLKQVVRLHFDVVNPKRFKRFLFIFNTHNQFLAKKVLYQKKINESYSLKNKFLVGRQIENSGNIPFWKIYLISMVILPIYWKPFNELYQNVYQKKIDRFNFFYDSIFTISIFILFNFYFKLKKPEFLVMSNDHSDVNVGILYAAKNHKVKTIYLQHANISELFPKMNFDFAFLYSIKAAQKYQAIGNSNTKFICVGNMKVDESLGLNQNRFFDPNNLIISLCINSLAELDQFIQLSASLTLLENVKKIKFRMHPSLTRQKVSLDSDKVIFSDTLNESSFKFFEGVNINIAGNSSIIEEAIMVDTPTIFFDLNKNLFDYYGYVKDNSVIKVAKDINSIVEYIKSYNFHISVFDKANLYSSSIGTQYEGRTVEIIENVLESIVQDSFPNQDLMMETSYQLKETYILNA